MAVSLRKVQFDRDVVVLEPQRRRAGFNSSSPARGGGEQDRQGRRAHEAAVRSRNLLGGTEGRDRRTTRASLSPLDVNGGRRPLMLLVGEVKEVAQARFGQKLVIKHLPDMPLMLPDDVHRRLKARFAAELEFADAIDGAHLIAIATFGRGAAGIASVEEIALVATTEHWVPIEHAFEAELVAARAHSGHRFVKGLRYNLKRTDPLVCVVLPWTRPRPTALCVAPPDADGAFASALDDLIAASDLPAWVWHTGAAMPPLPIAGR